MAIERRQVIAAITGGVAMGLAGIATAQAYPTKSITLVVPFPPGASTDVIARLIGQGIEAELKVPVVIDNKGGANGNIGAEFVAKAPPDGSVLLYNTSSLILSPSLYVNPRYSLKDFAPVARTVTLPLLYVSSNELGAVNVRELVDYGRKNPGAIAYGSAGMGNGTHLGAQLFFNAVEVEARHVPYKGGTQALVDLAGGRTQFYAGSLAAILPFIKDKRVRPMAVAASSRLAALPDVPTVSETVKPGFEAGLWQGVVAPANTPAPLIDRLNETIRKVLRSPALTERLNQEGALPAPSTPREYADYLRSEQARWGEVVRSAGIKQE